MIFGYTQITGNPTDVSVQYKTLMHWADVCGCRIDGIFSYPDAELLKQQPFDSGDTLLIANLGNFGNSLKYIREVLQYYLERGITIISAQNGQKIEPEDASLLKGIDLALDIRKQLLSRTTAQALAERKAAGVVLGRPQTAKIKKRLDGREAEISQLLAEGLSKADIARCLNVSRVTLYKFLKNRSLK